MTLDPTTLAFILGIPEKTLRRWLREDFPKKAPGKGGRWEITPVMGRKMALRKRVIF